MKVRVFREPCYFAESVYLLHAFVNHMSFEDDYKRVVQTFGHGLRKNDDLDLQRLRMLTAIRAAATEGLDPEAERLRYYFENLTGTDRKTKCCLAQVMLMAISLESNDLDAFAANLTRSYRQMQAQGIKINDINSIGLIVERWDESENQESLASQLERLPCSVEAKWQILRVLTDYEYHVRELTDLIRPVARRLQDMMEPLVALNEETLAYWSAYFETHTVDDFQSEMFNTTFLFAEENLPHEIWLGLWYFNMFGAWSEWLEHGAGRARVAYLGMLIRFDFAVKEQDRLDEESLCVMIRALGGKDKLEILRRCTQGPISAARLAADMNLNSGTVSRNLYSLFKLGYLETRGDGERVNYVTKLEAIEQLFRWVMEYVSDGD